MFVSISAILVVAMIFALHRALICADDRLSGAMWFWLGGAAIFLLLAVWPQPLGLLDVIVGALAYGMVLVVATAIWVATRGRRTGSR